MKKSEVNEIQDVSKECLKANDTNLFTRIEPNSNPHFTLSQASFLISMPLPLLHIPSTV